MHIHDLSLLKFRTSGNLALGLYFTSAASLESESRPGLPFLSLLIPFLSSLLWAPIPGTFELTMLPEMVGWKELGQHLFPKGTDFSGAIDCLQPRV